jgi:hypothetical protein
MTLTCTIFFSINCFNLFRIYYFYSIQAIDSLDLMVSICMADVLYINSFYYLLSSKKRSENVVDA